MPIDYSKWDGVAVDEEDEPAAATTTGLDPSREALRAEVEGLLKCEDAALLAMFVAVQKHDEGQPCNINRHPQIIEMVPKIDPEPLCALAQERFEQRDDRLGLLALEAVNTAEACRRYGALGLFEAVCTPTNDRAVALREAYARQTFGKLRLKRHMYREIIDKDPAMARVLDEHEAKELQAIDPVPSETKRRQKKPWWLLVPCVLLAILLLFK